MFRVRRSELCAGLALGFFVVSGCRVGLDEKTVSSRAREIHGRILTLDTHCDTAFNLLRKDWKIGDRHESGPRSSGKVDLPRMAEGGLDAEFFAAFVEQGPRTPEGYAEARGIVERRIDAIRQMTLEYPDLVGLALRPDDAFRLKKEGLRAAYIGIENGYAIGKDISLISVFHQKGVRYLTLCHTSDNDICDSSTDRRNPRDDGLSEFGKSVVRACNDAGMIIDVSHASDKSFDDVLKITRAPVIASHSCARALCDSPRNLSDGMLRALARNGGVMQMCFLSSYIKKPRPNPEKDEARLALAVKYGPIRDIQDESLRRKAIGEFEALEMKFATDRATVKDLVDHIDHAVRVAGIDHVGIGTDFDGGGGVIGCEDVSGMIRVTEELLRRGYSEKQLEKIWSGNFMRVFRRVIEAAEKKG
ncbi:MAG: dipeptidase [Acidobacteriota bacterium]|nr:dipeptidase [Acidobacteriota bacterium]